MNGMDSGTAGAPNPDLPARFDSVEQLEEVMTRPSAALCAELSALDGDIMVLGVGGKMGPSLARMARRAAPGKRVIGVARFSDPQVRDRLQAEGVECIGCDLLDAGAIAALPRVRNVVFMAGHKFGASDNVSMTWAMNVAVPFMVAESMRESNIVAFSTACVYPFVDVDGPGAPESLAATPPPGDYAASCVGRERMFEHGSRRYRTPGSAIRLSYAIDMRYGVLYDVASTVFAGRELDLTMGHVNVIWQGDANEQALRMLGRCSVPAAPINVSGPKQSVRWLAEEFGRRFGKAPHFAGTPARSAWLIDTSLSRRLLGPPSVDIGTMIDWVAAWVERGGPSLNKPTHFSTRDGKY